MILTTALWAAIFVAMRFNGELVDLVALVVLLVTCVYP
jgi:hypothetical protein